MEEFTFLLQNQKQAVNGMEQLWSNFKKDGQSRKTADYVKRKIDTLDLYWNEFQKNHETLCQYEKQDNEYFIGNHFELTKQYYNEKREAMLQQVTKSVIKPATPFSSSPLQMPTKSLNPSPEPGSSRPEAQFHSKMQTSNSTYQCETKEQGNNSRLDEMMRKQSSNFKAFGRTLKNIDLSHVSEKWEYEDILKNLESRWSVIDTLHWEIDSTLNGENEEYEAAFSMYENNYNDMKKQVNSMLWRSGHKDQVTPQLEIPEFHGSYQQWTSFKDLFTEAIHSNIRLSNAQKMQFLKSKIKGEPERLIQHLPISSDNYITCWEILNNRYNNKKLIFSTHMNTIMGLPVMQQATANLIKRLHDVTTECLNGIKNLGVDITTWDPMIVHILSQKLDPETHEDYVTSLKYPRDLPVLEDFLKFLEGKFTTMEYSRRKQECSQQKYNNIPMPSTQGKQQFKPFSTNNKQNFNKFQQGNRISCPVCSRDHGIYFCAQFREMDPSSQRMTINKLNFCSNCLYSHNGKPCQSNKRCKECNGYHNTILHSAFTTKNYGTPRRNTPSGAPYNNTHMAQQYTSEVLLATALVNVQDADNRQQTLRALIDQGSQVSIISEKAAKKLKLPKIKCKGIISGIGENNTMCKGAMNITCCSLRGGHTFETEVFVMKSLTRNLPSTTQPKPSWVLLDKIELADPQFYQSQPIDLLLGAEVYAKILLDGVQRGDLNTPIAQETKLGWILCGKIQSLQCNVTLNCMDDIQRFWQIEDIAESSLYTSEEEECVQFYKSTTTRLEDGRYQVRLPLKSTISNELGESKYKAIAQFQHLERKFSKHNNIATQYKSFIKEYLLLGHMTIARSNKQQDCYLPHHCVLREDSTTTSLRVVFNASAKTSNGTSLNDFMHKGPNLQKDLLSLIIKWRQHKIAFIADIEKMFRQLWIHPDDQNLQKIVWRDSPHQPLSEYQLTTVTYGTKAAPFLAMMTLKQLANDEKGRYSAAAQVIESSFYMDDLLYGTDSILSAKQIQEDLIQLLKLGGFNLRKWRSNHPELLQDTDKQDGQDNIYNFKQPESTKTLGLNWNPIKDQFYFQIDMESNNYPTSVTKRQLLSQISKLFDPLGWLTPMSTLLKSLFQRVWNENLEWDDKIPESIYKDWLKIMADLKLINLFYIPRWLGTTLQADIELHGFCDASQKAYGCVIYCKTSCNGNNNVILIAGKSRLIPIDKSISLPRLELSGAVLLTKLMEKVKESFSDHHIKMFGWVDSTAVLGWIQGNPERWKVFVANRVRQITEVMPSTCWRYVKSADNPADCASRGLTPSQLQQQDLWWHGPAWLQEFEGENNKCTKLYQTEEEVKIKTAHVLLHSGEKREIIEDLLNRCSSFTKALRILAWVRRFITKKEKRNTEKYITLEEIRKANHIIVTNIQESQFKEEIRDLKEKGQVSSKSKIFSLKPFIDKFGALRVGGRLEHANICREMKNPIILPHDHRLTQLIILNAHECTFHGGARVTTSFIRRKYWIVRGYSATKKTIHGCVICKKQNPGKLHQLMGDLPEARVNPSRPFMHTGVDFTGHVMIKANKGRGIKTTKAYVAVFVCMATKAVHLELVSDMTTSSFIAAIRRMAARRGTPRHIYCDNGRNFVGANRIMQQEYQEKLQIMGDEFMAEITDMQISWHFNAPLWPSAGGLWEAAVKSFKFHLKRVIGEQRLTFEEFTTLITQIEGCLNSRPLCAVSEDPEDLNYLTPAHFLTGGPTLNLIETETDLRTRWHMVQKIMQDLWKRWQSEYLIQLTARSKWRRPRRNISVGDVVLIHEDNLPPGKWAMGRVTELHQGKDGYVRVISLKTKSGIIRRPILKVSLLLENEEKENKSDLVTRQVADLQPSEAVTKSQRSRKVGCKMNFISLATSIMLFLMMLTNSQAYVNVTQFRENQHLYFDKIADMMLIRDEWKIIVYYNMEPYWSGIKTINSYIESLQTTCNTIRVQGHCDVVLLQLRHGFSELEYYNMMLLSQHKSSQAAKQRRRRRGLIDGIGYAANTLFGVLDERFAEQYQKDITLVRDNQKHLLSLWKNQTTIIEAEYNLLKRSESNMNQQHKFINQHINQLEKACNNLKSEVQTNFILNSFNTGAIVASNFLSNLKRLQDTLLDTITDIYQGRFNLHLLTPEQLKKELSIISTQLPKDMSLPIENLQTDLRKIYELLRVQTRMLEDVLIFEIKLPLVSRDTYEILKVISVPEKEGSNMISIVPVSDYISINMKRDVYMQFSENDLQTCLVAARVYLCQVLKQEFLVNGNTSFCEKENNECKTTTESCKNTWKEINDLNTHMYYCCGQCQVKTICGNQVTAYQLMRAGLIHVSDECIIKTDEFTISPHKLHSTEMKMNPDIYVPRVSSINHVINITIPKLTWVNESHQEELNEIKNSITALKNAEVLSDSVSYHDIHHYAMIYLLIGIVTVTCFIVAIRRWQCKWRVSRSPEAADTTVPQTQPEDRTSPEPRLQRVDSSTSPQADKIIFKVI